MAKVRSWVGLDVHAVKVIACAVDAESGEMTVHRMAAETSATTSRGTPTTLGSTAADTRRTRAQ